MKKSKKIGQEYFKKNSEVENEEYEVIGRALCDDYVSEHYGKHGFDSGEYMGGNTDLGLYGRLYYDKNGYVLDLVANVKTRKIESAELRKSS
jgi:hypothetical protein